jgi:hypothetical protein
MRVLSSIMSVTEGSVHCGTLQKWINSQPPYMKEEAVRSALRRLRYNGFVIKGPHRGYWKFNKKATDKAVKLIQSQEKAVDLVGVTSPPPLKDIIGLSGDWLDFARIRFEANEPFRFKIGQYETKIIRSACNPETKGKGIDRSHKRAWHGKTLSLSITFKGSIEVWAKELNFIQELTDLLYRSGISEEGTKRFFRTMFRGIPSTGTLEYPVKADREDAKILRGVTIETFQGDDKVKTRFVSSHDSIEMEQTGKIESLQTFLGMVTGVQHSSFFDALQVDKLSKIEELLGKNQEELSKDLKAIAGGLKLSAKAIEKLAEPKKPQRIPKPKDRGKGPGVG